MRFGFLREERFLEATGVLVGIMIGVGFYGIPFAFAKAGFLVGTLWLIALAVIIGFFDLLFTELMLSTKGAHQITGYVHIWLGPWARRVSMIAHFISLYGALLAYIIVVGEFLQNVLSRFFSIDPQLYSVGFAVVGAMAWLLRPKTIAKIELVFIALYTAAVVCIVAFGVRNIQGSHFLGWTPDFWYLPYGIILFALSGLSSLPVQRDILKGREHLIRPAIITALCFTVGLYLLFAAIVVGVSGDATSPAAFAGLFEFLGTPILVLGSLLGILTISTSYIMLGTALFETFRIDYGQSNILSWMLAVTPPVALFIIGFRNFIDIIGLVGGVALGTQCVLILASYLRARRAPQREPEVRVRVSGYVVVLCLLFFAAGVAAQFFLR